MNDKQKQIQDAIEHFNGVVFHPTKECTTHDDIALEALNLLAVMNGNTTAHHAAMMQAAGWMFANMCEMLDQGVDPRHVAVPVIMSKFENDFKYETNAVLVPAHCVS
jgi:hypothetical protein